MKKQNKWKALATELRDALFSYWKIENETRNRVKEERLDSALKAIQELEREEAK